MKEAVQWAIDHLVRLCQTPCPRNNEEWHEHINDLAHLLLIDKELSLQPDLFGF